MDILDERSGLDSSLGGGNSVTHCLLREQMLKDLDQWTVPAHKVNWRASICLRMGKSKSHQCFTGAGYTSEKANDKFLPRPGICNDQLDRCGDLTHFMLRCF